MEFCRKWTKYELQIRNDMNTESIGWLNGFNVELEKRSRLLLTSWESPLRVFKRHATSLSIHHGGDNSLVLVVRLPEREVEHLTVELFNKDLTTSYP